MLEIIGFLALNIGLAMATLAALIFLFEATGKYNIGGVPNSWLKRAICTVLICTLPFPWALLWANSPFGIHLRG